MSTPTPLPTPLATLLAGDPVLTALAATWPAYQGEVDTRALDTNIVRMGYPKPTIIREHETIHTLCNLVDLLRAELDEARATATTGAPPAEG